MGLETATFIAGLTAAWPTSGDTKSQGDDHIRLLKSTLQATFPNASKAFYFPTTSGNFTTTKTIVAADQYGFLQFDTSAGDVAATLPTLTGGDAGWECEVTKVTFDNNAVIVSPPSGTIASQVGATATIRVGQVHKPARFKWNGSTWICIKNSGLIGETVIWDTASTPPGYLLLDGSGFSATAYAELAAAYGAIALKDKRGRVEAGEDGGQNRLTSAFFGATANIGAVGGAESLPLTLGQIPAGILCSGTVSVAFSGNPSVPVSPVGFSVNNIQVANFGGGSNWVPFIGAGSWGAQAVMSGSATLTSTNTLGQAHRTVQPTIIVRKLIRAC